MTTKLATLRTRLGDVRRRRLGIRLGTGWSGFALAVLWTLVGLFLVDWLFAASVTQRVVLWLVAIGGLVWAYGRFTRPFLGKLESDVDVALLVERQQGIDSDLVAAMQFETPEAKRWGSARLESAVVDYVADFSPDLDVFEGLSYDRFQRRATLLSVTIVVLVAATSLFPQHASAFASRMLFGRAHYPTRTRIVAVDVNGTRVWPVSGERVAELEQRRLAAVAAQQRVVEALGELESAADEAAPTGSWFSWDEAAPETRTARMAARSLGRQRSLIGDVRSLDFDRYDDVSEVLSAQRDIEATLARDEWSSKSEALNTVLEAARVAAQSAAEAVGRLAPVVPYGKPLDVRVSFEGVEPTEGRLLLAGLSTDVRTEVPLSPDDESQPTAFSAQLPRMIDALSFRLELGDGFTDRNAIAVIPLPAVTVLPRAVPPEYAAHRVSATAAGRLQQSVVEGSRLEFEIACTNKRLQSATVTIDETAFALSPVDRAERRWQLDVVGTPFEYVTEAVRYSVQVVDVDGLSLERPINGFVRLEADRGPRITAGVKYGLPIALPDARRTLAFRASDDFGLSRVGYTLDIVRAEGDSQRDERLVRAVDPKRQPVREIADELVLDLAPLGLELGDEVKITFEATDHRGTLEPKSNVSEPLVFRIASEADVLREMQKLDERAERDLDAIIRRELGIGDSP